MDESLTFRDLGLSEAMLKALEKKGYGYPTTIQAEAIPHFMQWKDVIAKAGLGQQQSAPALAAPVSLENTPAWQKPETLQDDFSEDPEEQEYEEQMPEELSIRSVSMDLIEKVLRKHGGNRKAAAAELGISERTLYRKLKQMN